MHVHQVWCELVEHNYYVARVRTKLGERARRFTGVVEVGWSSAIMHTVHNDTQLELNPPAYRQPVQLAVMCSRLFSWKTSRAAAFGTRCSGSNEPLVFLCFYCFNTVSKCDNVDETTIKISPQTMISYSSLATSGVYY